jgi:hypothetical protein
MHTHTQSPAPAGRFYTINTIELASGGNNQCAKPVYGSWLRQQDFNFQSFLENVKLPLHLYEQVTVLTSASFLCYTLCVTCQKYVTEFVIVGKNMDVNIYQI